MKGDGDQEKDDFWPSREELEAFNRRDGRRALIMGIIYILVLLFLPALVGLL